MSTGGKGTVPAELRVGHDVIPCLAHVGEESIGVVADEAGGYLLDCHADLV